MQQALKGLGLLMTVVIVLSVAQVPSAAYGPFVVLAMLLGILGFAVSGGRQTRSMSRPARARKPSFLVRYGLFTEASVPAAALSGAAYAEAANAANRVTIQSATMAALFGGFALHFLSPRIGAGITGIIGVIAVLYTFFLDDSLCREALSTEGLVMFAAVLIAGVGLVGITRIPAAVIPAAVLPASWSMRLPSPLPHRRKFGTWVLALFGLVELAAFAAQPAGIDIWTNAPPIAAWVFVALLVVVASFGYYAPELVVGLCALGVFLASVYLTGIQLGGEVGACAPIELWFSVTIAGALGAAGGSLFSLNRF